MASHWAVRSWILLYWNITVFTSTGSSLGSIRVSEEITEEVCLLEQFSASCSPNEVVHITSAHFGHLHLGRCVPFDIGHFGCHADVTNLIDEKCAGRRECQLDMPDKSIESTQPCNRALTTFLEARYRCIAGRPDTNLCRGVQVSRTPGFFTSLAALRSRCSDHSDTRRQIRLSTTPGQKIQLTVIDTKYWNTTSDLGRYITINGGILMNDSGSNQDELPRTLYGSSDESMEMTFITGNGIPNFIIIYKATGCLDYRPLAGMWHERQDDNVTVGCYATEQTWQLTCSGSKWSGAVGNCTVKATAAPFTTSTRSVVGRNTGTPAEPLTRGVLIVTILGSTVVLCGLVITTACVYIRCLKSKHQTKSKPQPRVQYALSPQDAALLLGNGIQDGAQRNSWHNTMPLPHNNDQHGPARKDYMTMFPMS